MRSGHIVSVLRIGIGFDIHRLVKGRKLFLGGLEIPHDRGLLGHSDGDVLLHALADALLGAAALGDIGEHFPDSDPQWKDVRSETILAKVLAQLARRRLVPQSVDSIIFAEEPKLGSAKAELRNRLAKVLGLEASRVNVKAKTMEGLTVVGHSRAIAAQVIVTVVERTSDSSGQALTK